MRLGKGGDREVGVVRIAASVVEFGGCVCVCAGYFGWGMEWDDGGLRGCYVLGGR